MDDFEPFRSFVSSALRQRPELEVIGEVSDGLAAVHAAEKLKPDLILLDIGLPTLNGIEAARLIIELIPTAKIIFLTQESADEVMQEALLLGAKGYVFKSHAGSDLMPAVEAVLQGRQFVSGKVTDPDSGVAHAGSQAAKAAPSDAEFRSREAEADRRHEILFYANDASFLESFSRFIRERLADGNAAIVIATDPHRAGLREMLQAQGVDAAAAEAEGRYISLSVQETLATFMVDRVLDEVRFARVALDLIRTAAKAVNGDSRRVSACGECAPELLAQGQAETAIRLEQLWDMVARRYGVRILCGYPANNGNGAESNYTFSRICAEHSSVHADGKTT